MTIFPKLMKSILKILINNGWNLEPIEIGQVNSDMEVNFSLRLNWRVKLVNMSFVQAASDFAIFIKEKVSSSRFDFLHEEERNHWNQVRKFFNLTFLSAPS